MDAPRKLFAELAIHWCDRRPLRVLDIGCGSGKLIEYLAGRDAEMTFVGIDSSHDLVQAARQRCDSQRAAIYHTSVESLGDDIGTFDLAVSFASLRLWEDPVGGLSRAYDLLNPSGVMFLSDLCGDTGLDEDVIASLPEEFQTLLRSQLAAAYSIEELESIAGQISIEEARVARGGLAGYGRMSDQALEIVRDNPVIFEILMDLNMNGGGLPHPAASELIAYLFATKPGS